MTRIVPTFWPLHFSKSNCNNGPSTGHSRIGSDRRYTCSSLKFMVWWVPYLNKNRRPDFNNGPEMNWIVAAVWPPDVHLRQNWVKAPPQAIPTLCQMEYTHLFKSPSYSFLAGAISVQGLQAWLQWWPGRWTMAWVVTRIVAPFLPSGFYLNPTRIMAPPWAILMLNCNIKELVKEYKQYSKTSILSACKEVINLCGSEPSEQNRT